MAFEEIATIPARSIDEYGLGQSATLTIGTDFGEIVFKVSILGRDAPNEGSVELQPTDAAAMISAEQADVLTTSIKSAQKKLVKFK